MDVDHNGVLDAPCAEARRSIVGGTNRPAGHTARVSESHAALFMFLLPDGWVDLQCSGDDDLYGRGEVVLGDDVVSRLVRSVKLTVPTP
jgi:hypothetical protein